MADTITGGITADLGIVGGGIDKAASLGGNFSNMIESRKGRKDDLKPTRDAFTSFRFFVQIDSVNVAEFTECSALTIETEIFEYQEGGVNTYTHKLPVRSKYSNITLKHGIDEGEDLFSWYLRTLEEPQPSSSDGKVGSFQANSGSYRRNISIICYDSLGKIVRRWDLHNAFPVKWIGPDWKAGQSAVAIESIEIAHAGLVPQSAPTVSTNFLDPGALFGAAKSLIGAGQDGLKLAEDAMGDVEKSLGGATSLAGKFSL